ncbi:phosphatidylserine decarboxylase [Lachnospiraceae bacterium 50-23]|jgi:phosphatidylserine decarboxylase|nr:phosphatidylserine decarboxylase [Dorea sp.]GFI37400.1 phosphatidylserine decarboxylase proenzyme [Lachnospiraceae bacterium]
MRKETLTIRFLYGTIIGRAVLKILTRPFLSRYVGIFLNSGLSRWMVPLFIKKHHIDMTGCEKKKYTSFNDFFTRRRRVERTDITPDHLISPCDGYLSVYPVDKDQSWRIKHVEYNLEDLLGSRELAERFCGGTCLIFRLTPQNYHRYCYVCSGDRGISRSIRGRLHCVRPAAYTSRPVFVENSREYLEIRTQQFGDMIQMEIGALLVGKIHNYHRKGRIHQGIEKGYFEFGGSTILVLVQEGRVNIDCRIVQNMKRGAETKVRLGEMVGELH